MSVVFNQVLILFIFIVVGYFMSKKNIVNRSHSKILSALVVYVFLPCKVFKTFSVNFTLEYLSNNYMMLIVSCIILAFTWIGGHFGAKLFSNEPYKRDVYKYILMVPNMGYMGYPLAEMLYGSEFLLDVIVFGLPLSVYINTFGYCMLTKTKISFKKLFQPVIISIVIGTAAGLSGLKVPSVIGQVIDSSSGCMAPVCMLLTGIAISEFDVMKMLCDKKAYILSALRLIVVPCLIALVLKQFCSQNTVLISIMIYAMPCGLNTVVFPKLVGESCEIGAGTVCISSVLACLTIPLCVWMFGG